MIRRADLLFALPEEVDAHAQAINLDPRDRIVGKRST
jgi:hypothetical protein